MQMGFSHYENTWKANIDKFGSIGINKLKDVNLNWKGELQRKGLAQP
jgi:hypothetical protein